MKSIENLIHIIIALFIDFLVGIFIISGIYITPTYIFPYFSNIGINENIKYSEIIIHNKSIQIENLKKDFIYYEFKLEQMNKLIFELEKYKINPL